MFLLRVAVTSLLIAASWTKEDLTFPPGFQFGVASSSYQVEGAWNVSDKGESIWDRLTHAHPELIDKGDNGDVACDSYHLWKRDLEMLEELGVHFYRFSISWPRLLPNGFPYTISEDGKNYYNSLIDGLLEKGIEPIVTLYHWDLPQHLQNYGGWVNPLIIDWFADYARVAFTLFGDRVKTWITINEPLIICDLAYGSGIFAPGISEPDFSPFLCNKHVLLAHAKAWRIYDKEFRPKFNGQVSIANQLIWFEPKYEDDAELAELTHQNCGGRYSHPIYSEAGGWPPTLEIYMEDLGKRKGYNRSMLPSFTKDDIALIRGTYDFYAMNHYTSRVVRRAQPGEQFGIWPFFDCPDLNMKAERPEQWTLSDGVDWFWVNPEGFRKQLIWIKKNYGDVSIVVTENGYATLSGLEDQARVDYYSEYLKQLLLAIKEDGVNVTKYTAWTLMDNFEWGGGYSTKFGLYEVDFSSPNRTRTPRASAKFFANVIKTHSLPMDGRDEL